MSSPGPPSAGDQRESASGRESGTVWHPAREWLEQDEEEDEHDPDFDPWTEMDEDNLDEEIMSEQAEEEYQAYLGMCYCYDTCCLCISGLMLTPFESRFHRGSG